MQLIKSFLFEEQDPGNPRVLTVRSPVDIRWKIRSLDALCREWKYLWWFLLFGAGGFLADRKFPELLVAIGKLAVLHMGICCAVSAQTQASHKLNCVRRDNLFANTAAVSELVRKIKLNLEKLSARAAGIRL